MEAIDDATRISGLPEHHRAAQPAFPGQGAADNQRGHADNWVQVRKFGEKVFPGHEREDQQGHAGAVPVPDGRKMKGGIS